MALDWKVCKVKWRRRNKRRTSIIEALDAHHAKTIIRRRAGARQIKVLYCKPAAPLRGSRR